MVKIIETNITMNDDGDLNDFQSRVIEVDSWDSYVDEMKSGESKVRTSCIGNLHGLSLPRVSETYNHKCDDFHLSFEFVSGMGTKMKKLAYLINE